MLSQEFRYKMQSAKWEFSEWARDHPHTILVSYPKSGRNWIASLIARSTGKRVMRMHNVVTARDEGPFDYKKCFLYACHRGIWHILGERGRFILLIRDPRDAFLSSAYHRGDEENPAVEDIELRLQDPSWLAWEINNWRTYFDVFPKSNPLLVQYEKCCLYPVETVTAMLQFLHVPRILDIRKVVTIADSIKPDARIPNKFKAFEFATDLDRYNAHCLKWQRDDLADDLFLRTVWTELGDIKLHYGYTETWHDLDKWANES